MYAELDLKFRKPMQRTEAIAAIRNVIGRNKIDVSAALAGDAVMNQPQRIKSALAAERILAATTIVYFMEGSDIIKVYIAVRSLAEVRKQCTRISRQLSGRIGALSAATATVLVRGYGADEAVMIGARVSFFQRLWIAAADKAAAKLLPSVATFVLAAHFLPATTVVGSAAIGVLAAAVGILMEAAVVAVNSGEWSWKDVS